MVYKISDDTKRLVVELKLKGFNYNQIKEQTGISKGSISSIIKENNLSKTNIIELTDNLLEQIQKRYDEIGNIKIVAKEFHISYNRLSKLNNFKRSIVKKTNYDTTKENRYKKKKLLVEYKGGKCEVCGYDKCLSALEFHHIDASEKDFAISSSSKCLEELKLEADKCILVCANCHREIHSDLNKN